MGIQRRFARFMRSHALFLVGTGTAVGLLLYRLSTLPAYKLVSQAELVTADHSASLRQLVSEPLYLPFTALQWLFTRLLPDGATVFALRLPSVIFALIAIVCVIFIVRRWYGQKAAIFGFAVLISSAWLLHVGRLATFDILYLMAIPLVLATHLLLLQTPHKTQRLLLWLVVVIVLLYVPGLVWLAFLQIIWQRKALGQAFRALQGWWRRILLGVGVVIGLAPLAYGFIKNQNYDYLLTWFGLPTAMPDLLSVGKNFLASIGFIFTKTPADPARWLGELPLLGAFMLVSLVAGIIFYANHLRAERTKLLIAISLLSLLLLTVGGPVSRSLLVPVIYIIAIGGIAYILHFWLKLFPRNPIARRLGIIMLGLAVTLTCVYGLRQYFVAWPHNNDTESAFTRVVKRP